MAFGMKKNKKNSGGYSAAAAVSAGVSAEVSGVFSAVFSAEGVLSAGAAGVVSSMGSREVLDFVLFSFVLPGFFSAFERALVMASSST